MIKNLKLILIVTALLAGIIGIGLITIIDDHSHIGNPDPDCPLCLAAQTNFLFISTIVFVTSLSLLLYIKIQSIIFTYSTPIKLTFSSRAPPLF